jgi:hypothetical protein
MTLSAALAVLLAGPASCADLSSTTLKGMDVYRSDKYTLAELRKAAHPQLDAFLRARLESRSNEKVSERLRGEAEQKLRALKGLAFVALSLNEYVTSAERTAYLTFDVVEWPHAQARMPRLEVPRQRTSDPEGLLETWNQYASLGETLARQGLVEMPSRPNCPGHYCLWGAATPELGQLQDKLIAGAGRNSAQLNKTLALDSDPRKRAAALYVLSYAADGRALRAAVMSSLRDPAVEVRSAALLIAADLALYHKDLELEAGPILERLDAPTVAERAKALGVAAAMSNDPAYRKPLLRAMPVLLGLLKMRQPANQDLAYTVLGALSHQSFDRSDFASWQAWAAENVSPSEAVSGVQSDRGE